MPLQSSRPPGDEKPALVLRLATSRLGVRLRHLFGLVTGAKTLGVRVAAFNAAGEVLLVRHTYMAGWHLPGGAVDAGETAEAAALRELREEANAAPPDGRLRLHAVYFHRSQLRRDHVLLFTAREIRQPAARRPDREIAEARFFAPDALPKDTTPATLRRLAELRTGAVTDPEW